MRDRTTQRIAAIGGAIGLALAAVVGATQKSQPTPAPPPPPPAPSGVEVLWETPVSFAGGGNVAAGESLIFLVSAEAGLSAYSPLDGKPVWTSTLTSVLRPSASGEHVAVVSNGSLQVLNQKTQAAVWTAEVGTDTSAIFALRDRFGAVIGQEIRVWSPDGAKSWHTALPGLPVTRVTSNGGTLFVGVDDPSAGPALVALDDTTGAIRWQLPLKARPESLTATDDRLYFGAADAALYSVRTTGQADDTWRYALLGTIGDPIADAHQVYFSLRDNSVRAFERHGGSLRWDRPQTHRPATGPMRLGKNLVVALANGVVVEILPKDGHAVAPKVPAPKSGARLQGAAISHDATRVFTLTIAGSTSQKLIAWGHPPEKR